MSTITQYLRQEHEQILDALSKLAACGRILEREFDIRLCTYISAVTSELSQILQRHHFNEEHVLFPALLDNPRLSGGGPRCTFFMNDWIDQQATRPQKDMTPMERSPLGIPMEEHVQLRDLLQRIQALSCDRCAENSRELINCIHTYDRKLRRHIEKEDTCLFMLAESILDARTLHQLSTQVSRDGQVRTGA